VGNAISDRGQGLLLRQDIELGGEMPHINCAPDLAGNAVFMTAALM
jgi:hypothetical protein